jgi:hypothetical protein
MVIFEALRISAQVRREQTIFVSLLKNSGGMVQSSRPWCGRSGRRAARMRGGASGTALPGCWMLAEFVISAREKSR